MPNTGNPIADATTYEQAKTVWLQNHPEVQTGTLGQTSVLPPTEVENAAYEQQKSSNYGAAVFATLPVNEQAAIQHRTLRVTYDANYANWTTNNVRMLQAYQDALSMARGNTVVNIAAADYATFFRELKTLVDENSALFHVQP